MKKLIIVLLLSGFAFDVLASSAQPEEKSFNIGIGSYFNTIVYDSRFLTDDDFTGATLSLSYAISDQFALRTNFYSMEHEDFSSFESEGFDLLAFIGVGLATTGIKAYVGGGYFSEQWDGPSVNERFNGLQINGGIGYNWQHVAVDFSLGLRDPSDYEAYEDRNSTFRDTTAASLTGSLLISFRF